jgi:hypothetical protein
MSRPRQDVRAARPLAALSLVALAALTLAVLLSWFLAQDWLEARSNETGPIEYGSALFFLAAALGFAAAAWRRSAGRWYAWGLAAACFVVAGEELSWGQHIFHFGSPEPLRKSNVQSEFNFHNLNGIHQSIRAVGILALVTVFVILPVAYRWWPSTRRICDRYHVPIFPIWPAAWWAVGALFMLIPRLLGGSEWVLDELGELYVAIAFFLYGLVTYLGLCEPSGRGATAPLVRVDSGSSETPNAPDDRVPLVGVDQVGREREAHEHERAHRERQHQAHQSGGDYLEHQP